MTTGTSRTRLIGAALILGWVAIGSVLLYRGAGGPEVSDAQGSRPLDSVAPRADLRNLPSTPIPEASARPPLADVDTMIARLAARLEREPDDLEGWKMLGWSHFRTDNFEGAAQAYARAVELAPDDANLLTAYGEAMVAANEGTVDERAQGIFDQALALDAANPRARYFRGIALDQRGETAAAIDGWLDLLDKAPPDADFLPELLDRIRSRAEATGYDLAGRLGAPEQAGASAANGPTQADIQAAQQMSAEDRQAMIRGMVDGLAARLADNPEDPDGWAQLIRSYVVLEDRAAAEAALADARQAFSGRAQELAFLAQVATSLGLQ